MYEYGTPDSGQYVDPTQGGALGEIFEYSLGSQIPRTKAPKNTALRGLGATAALATKNAINRTMQRTAGACCDTCSCNCAGSGCCPDCVARGVRRSSTAMQGLGATPRMVTVVGLPTSTPPLPLPYQPLPGALPTSSPSSMLPILLLGGLGVGAFLVIRRMRARAAAPASNPRRRRRRH